MRWSTEASWYEDGGNTASGRHARDWGMAYGVASHFEGQPDWAGLPFGMVLRICRADDLHRCIDAVVQDRGPYIAGRELDLNPAANVALGCSTCEVRYGPVR